MKSVWVDSGNDADGPKLAKYGIDRAYFALTDPDVGGRIKRAKTAGLKTGVYFAWNWYPSTLSGPQLADHVSKLLTGLGFTDYGKDQVAVCADIEVDDIAGYVVPFFQRWRQHRPNRVTDWTLEGMKGGLFTPIEVVNISRCSVLLAPQLYKGDMTPQNHSVMIDLMMAGFQGYQLVGMYDAAALPWRWNGYAFTQGRLP